MSHQHQHQHQHQRSAVLLAWLVGAAACVTPGAGHAFTAGEYVDGSPKSSLVLQADGRVKWSFIRGHPGSDIVATYSGTGTVKQVGPVVHVRIDPKTVVGEYGDPIPKELAYDLDRQFYQVKAAGRTFLLDDTNLTGLVNHANGYVRMPVNADSYLHLQDKLSPPNGSPPLLIPVEQLLPPKYLQRVLSRPLEGQVLAVTDITQGEVNVAGWMRPPEYKTQYTGRLKVNVGAQAGVFPGMRLYVGAPRMMQFDVESVGPHDAQGTAKWIAGVPTPGMPVSSASYQSNR